MMQQLDKLPDMYSVKQASSEAKSKLSSNLVEKIVEIEQSLPAKSVRAVKHTKQKKCASNWLSTLPLEEQGFTLTKSEFRDALALRYANYSS